MRLLVARITTASIGSQLQHYQLVQLTQLCLRSDKLARFIPIIDVLGLQADIIRRVKPELCPIQQLHRQWCHKSAIPCEAEFFISLLELSVLRFIVLIGEKPYRIGLDYLPSQSETLPIEFIRNSDDEQSRQNYVNWMLEVLYGGPASRLN